MPFICSGSIGATSLRSVVNTSGSYLATGFYKIGTPSGSVNLPSFAGLNELYAERVRTSGSYASPDAALALFASGSNYAPIIAVSSLTATCTSYSALRSIDSVRVRSSGSYSGITADLATFGSANLPPILDINHFIQTNAPTDMYVDGTFLPLILIVEKLNGERFRNATIILEGDTVRVLGRTDSQGVYAKFVTFDTYEDGMFISRNNIVYGLETIEEIELNKYKWILSRLTKANATYRMIHRRLD